MIHVVHTTQNDADVTIDGELICESTSRIDLTEYDERTITLKAFALTGGGFAAVVEFVSSNFNIPDVLEVERVDTAQDVEIVFSMFEPTEHVSDRTLRGNSRYESESNRLRKQLKAAHYKAIDDVVNAVNEYVNSHPDCEYIKAIAVPPAPNRILKFLGLA